MAAHQQGKFWEMHDLLFSNQHALGRQDLLRYARQLNLDMERFQADLDSDQSAKTLDSDKREAEQLGVSATPTFFVQGEMLAGAQSLDAFSRMIDPILPASARLPGKTLPPATSVAGAPAPAITAAKASARSTEKTPPPSLSRDDDSSSFGPRDAAVTLSWFADLQSPLTVKADELVHQLLQEYPGKIRIVFKHRPLEFHRDAVLAHSAVVAAGEQGRFWEMEKIVLAHQEAITHADLLSYAAQIGLDQKRFADAIDDRKNRVVIDTDLAEARYRDIRGTPVFFVNAKRLDGLQSLPMFKSYIDAELRSPHPTSTSAMSSGQTNTTLP
jgi:protein-disulfide isomerase